MGDKSPVSSKGISRNSGEDLLFDCITRSSVISRRTMNCISPINLFEAHITPRNDRDSTDAIQPCNYAEPSPNFFRRSLNSRRGLQALELSLGIPLMKTTSNNYKTDEELPPLAFSVGRQTSFQQDCKKSPFYKFCSERPPCSPAFICSENHQSKPRVLSCVEQHQNLTLFTSCELDTPSK